MSDPSPSPAPWQSPDGRCSVVLAGDVDEAGFRKAARTLIAHAIAPEQVQWRVGEERDAGLWSPAEAGGEQLADIACELTVPRSYAELLGWVLLHQDSQRHALLYQLLWRLQHEPTLRGDPLDAQWLQAARMAQAVRRDLHKMKAFVRFRTVERTAPEPPLHVAWFEPGHHVVERAAPFFAGRFANLHWRILTPLRSVSWDGELLLFGPGVARDQAPPADAGEALWLIYYEHIFNPARLKLAMMRKEMPQRYWKNLPEARLIQPLADGAERRSRTMIEQLPTEPSRKRVRLPALPAAPAALPAALLDVAASAASAAQRTTALAETRRAAAGCMNCPLYADATQTVFGVGDVDVPLMFVGEQPGDHEDLRGQPFVGPAGKLFDRALAELGLARDRVYITNAVKHFKYELRGQRRIHKTPLQQEVAACLDWLDRELALVRPQRVVALGATAARALLGRPVAVTRERGRWSARSDGLAVLITLHPSALLRMPPEEWEAAYRLWLADLKLAGSPDDGPAPG